MAGNTKNIVEILEELFKGRDAALAKYAKVRFTRYEMNLYWRLDLPLEDVAKQARVYFSNRFLNKERIDTVPMATLSKAIDRLDHAEKDGCRPRCLKLVQELNEALKNLGLEPVNNPNGFLDWLTFDYEVKRDCTGSPVTEPGYGFEIRIFHNEQNREEFWTEVQNLIKEGKMMSMQDIVRVVMMKRRKSVKI